MTLDEDIAFWEREAREAKTRSLALIAQGVAFGLRIAKAQHLQKKPE